MPFNIQDIDRAGSSRPLCGKGVAQTAPFPECFEGLVIAEQVARPTFLKRTPRRRCRKHVRQREMKSKIGENNET